MAAPRAQSLFFSMGHHRSSRPEIGIAVLVSRVSLARGMAEPDENGFVALVNTFLLPLFLLSTALIERDHAPGNFWALISLNPFTYAIDSLRNLLLDGVVDWGPMVSLAACL